MTGIVMFDGTENALFPDSPEAVAGYVDGALGDQPNAASLAAQFPKAHHLSIALFAGHDADCLDVEPGAAQVTDIPGWYAKQAARGVSRPVIYASVSTMEAEIVPVVMALPGARGAVRLWTAHYGLGEHICGPHTCGLLSIDADGTQWTSTAMGRNLDQSILLPDFFGTPRPPAPPADWTFGPVRSLTVTGAGPHSVSLSWDSPALPVVGHAVGWYQVVVQHNGTDVGSYPRAEPKGANPETWQGGSLHPGTAYEAMVRAVAKDGGHASPWATVAFKTAAA